MGDDFFRLLGAGAHFDRRKHRQTMEIFQEPRDSARKSNGGAAIGSLNFFKKEVEAPKDDKLSAGTRGAAVARKRKAEDEGGESGSKKKKQQTKKKKQTTSADDDEDDPDADDDHNHDDDVDDDDHNDSESDADEHDADEDGGRPARKGADEDDDSGVDPTSVVRCKTKAEAHELRGRLRIKVTGDDVPDPTPTFPTMTELYKLRPFLVESLKDAGYTRPTAIQAQAFPLIMQKREIFGIAPTGSGKTLAFLLPILHHLKAPAKDGFRAVVIVPTRELAQQTYREFKKLSGPKKFRACVLTKARANENTLVTRKFDILITTPMRLVVLIQQKVIDLKNVEHLVLDEGDRLLELGFLEQVDEILAACTQPAVRHYLFSATLPANIEQLAMSLMRDPVRVTVGARNAAAETIKQQLVFVGAEEGKLLAVRQLIQRGIRPPVLIFVQSIERAKELFHELIYDGINVDVIHSERTQAQRDQIVGLFRSGKIWVLIATELMSRGMDFKGVSLVVNYDFPQSVVSYIHRIGRAGRAGRPGEAVTYFTKDDAEYLRSIANVMKASGCDVPEWMLELKKPTKEMKKRLRLKPIERDSISTVPVYDLKRRERKQRLVEQSKERGRATRGDRVEKKKKKAKSEGRE